MEPAISHILVLVAVLGAMAQWIAWKLRVPAIIFLMLGGFLAGPVLGLVHPSRDFGNILQPLIGLFVAVILFEGGLNLKLAEFRSASRGIRRLIFPGVPIAWTLGTLATRYIGGLSWPISLLFGAIIVVTGPTVIMPILKHARLKRKPASYLKWEGIVNDPIGAVLAVLVYEYLLYRAGGLPPQVLFLSLAAAVTSALVLGAATGYGVSILFRKGHVPEYLKPPLLLASVLAVYSVSNLLFREAGLIAATVMGVTVGNMALPSIGELRRFKEYLTILLVSGIFILLSADLDPTVLARLELRGTLLLVVLLLIVRPLTILFATLGSDVEIQERVLLGWIAPRGIVAAAVAGLFGIKLEGLGYPDAALLTPLVFGLILLTVTVHGLSIGTLSNRLGLSFRERNGVLFVGGSPWTNELAGVLNGLGVPVMVADTSWHRLRSARLSGLRVYFGEVLSERTEESMEWNEFGYLLAATSNDAYNALVCTHFAGDLGRARVYQLPIFGEDERSSRGLPNTLRGVEAFDEEVPYEELQSRHYRGWVFQKTRFTDEYTYDSYIEERSEGVMEVILLKEDGRVILKTHDMALMPAEPGDTLVSFVAPSCIPRPKPQEDVKPDSSRHPEAS